MNTLLMIAIHNDNTELAEFLIEFSNTDDILLPNYEDKSALNMAQEKNNSTIENSLIVKIEAYLDNSSVTPYVTEAESGQLTLTKKYVKML